MRAARSIAAVDSHTEGMPTRVVVGGVAPIPGATMLERRDHFAAELDDLRLLLMREPRGHGAMSGAILQPATRPDADWGVLFIEVSGLLPMCGHGTIGVATVLVETGMVEVREPETVVRLDTPAGLVEARVVVEGGRARSVTLRNVPSFLHGRDRSVEVPGLGPVVYDMAFGGNFYALLPAASVGLAVDPARADELIGAGLAIIAAIDAADRPVHPERRADGGLQARRALRAGARRRRLAGGDGDPSRLARPLAVRDGDLRAARAAPCPRGARGRRSVRQRVGDRDALHRARGGGDDGGRRARDRARDHRPRLDHRHGPVPARRRGSVPGRLRPVSDVVVVGAGIVGAAVARELAVRGVAVTLLDRGAVSGGTTGLGEGNVLCSDKDAGPELELTRAGLALYGELEARLGDEARIRRKGALIVHPEAATWAGEAERVARVGIPEARLLDADEVRALEPELTGEVAARASSPATCSATRARSRGRWPARPRRRAPSCARGAR